jgi:hypothetical protein
LARLVLDWLVPFRVGREDASSWPGTELIGHTAVVYRYRLNADMVEQLALAADGLFDWVEPRLPEDPSLLREDGTAWLTTTAHERDAYFTLTAEEHGTASG